jgi:LuxR family maltose regulon positive regulatory protein
MWVKETGHPVAWVTLEKSDNDLRQFLTYVLTGLQRARDGLGQAALEVVQNAEGLNLQRSLGLLINDLCELDEPIILVLEDYHLIENEQVDQVIELMLNQAIPNLHLVITTREDPNLPLTRLRVRNQLTEVRAADLSFSVEEACEFFSNVMGVNLSTKDMETLRDRTEGWVAGLQLAALSLRDSGDPTKFVAAFRGTHRHVLDYLMDEVLNSQPAEVRDFLYRTSILDQLSPSLCEAVTGQQASRRHLQYLETNNLFLVSLDEERTWYRYHDLFAELLRNQLMEAQPERVEDLHERAASWYEENGFIKKAVEHSFQVSNGSKACKLIEQYAVPMLYRGEVAMVVGWFGRLPESVMQNSPMMCIGKAWSLALTMHETRGEKAVEQTLQAAERALHTANADEALRRRIAGHAASIQAYVMRFAASEGKDREKLIETAQIAQQLLTEDEQGIRSINALSVAHGYQALANLPAAEAALRQAYEYGVAGGNLYAAVSGPITVILLDLLRGELKDALQVCETNIDRFNQLSAGQNFPPIGALCVMKGCLLLEEDRLAEAEEALTQGLSLLQWTGGFACQARGQAALARLRSIQGDWGGSLESIKSLGETLPESALYAEALRHRFSVSNSAADDFSLEQAHLWLAQVVFSFDNLPDISGVDELSEFKFEAYLSVAHVLTRLAIRDPRAHSLLDVRNYLTRQERFAESHGLFGWLIEIWIVRALMYHVEGRAKDARHMIRMALSAAVPRGYFRIFLDESDLLRPLLESVEAGPPDNSLCAFVRRLLESMPGESHKGRATHLDAGILSDRELEVLGLLAAGQTYEEIGRQLFLSLNTIQFHVKSIYRKLSVNKRVQAIERARELNLI